MISVARFRLATEALPWLALALSGFPGSAIAAYLTYSRLADQPTACGGVGQCELVQTSEYSDIAGVPVALMGLLYFVVISGLAWLRLAQAPPALQWGGPLALSLSLAATAFVAYLTYVELFILEAICPWCVGLAAVTVASLLFSIWAAVYPPGET